MDTTAPPAAGIPKLVARIEVATGPPPRVIPGACGTSNHAYARSLGADGDHYETLLRAPATCYLPAGHGGPHMFTPHGEEGD